jgi:hypothetical protein
LGLLSTSLALVTRTISATTLQNNINTEADTRQKTDTSLKGDITTEQAVRLAADQTLQQHIDAEALTRANADAGLRTDLTAETEARTNADTALGTRIDSEATARSDADTTLQANINTETSARKATDTTLQQHIDAEANTRATADTTLQNNLNAEISVRSGADQTLQSNIDTKVTANAAIIGATATKITYDTKGLVTAGTSLSATDIPTIQQSQIDGLAASLATKVDKQTGYSLMSDAERTKLSGIAAGAEVNVQSNWTEADTANDDYILNKPTLGTAAALDVGTAEGNVPQLVANGKLPNSVVPDMSLSQFKGNLTSKAALITLSTAETGDYAIVANATTPADSGTYVLDGAYTTLDNWHCISTPGGAVNSVNGYTGNVSLSAADVSALPATTAYGKTLAVNGRTVTLKDQNGTALSSVQTQDTTYSVATTTADGLISSTDKIYLDSVPNALASKVTANAAITANTADLVFPSFDAKGLVTGALGNAYVKAIYVNGTGFGLYTDQYERDLNLIGPVTYGTAGQVLLSSGDAAAPVWSTLTKSMVGLGNVDNTSDADKPISTATQTALDAKVTGNAAITAGTGTKITYDTKGLVTAGTTLAASDIPTIAQSQVTNLTSDLAAKQNSLTFDTAPTSGSGNPVTSGGVYTALAGKAPTSHASTATTYGAGTTSNYGHVMLVDALTDSSLVTGKALSSHQGYMLSQSIINEASARASADTTLQTNITNEASSRASADTTLRTNITNEASTRASADTTLQTNIDAKQNTVTFVTVSVPTASWSSGTQTVTVTGMTATANATIGITAGQAAATYAAILAAQIDVTAQAANAVTLTCYGDAPSMDVQLTLALFG